MKTEMTYMNDLTEVVGGVYTNWGAGEEICMHSHKAETGKRKIETDTVFFLSVYRTMIEYRCLECGQTFWEEE